MSTVTSETPAAAGARLSWFTPTRAALAIAAGVLLLVSVGYQLPAPAHYMGLPVLERMVDPDLYPGDYYVDEMMRFTPRFYIFNLIAGLSRLGPSLPAVFFATYCMALAALVFTTFTLGKTIGETNVSGAIAAFLVLLPAVPNLGSTGIFFRTPIEQTYAVPLAVWGFVQCYRSRWVHGYAMFGLAGLFQFLVGFFAGALVAPYLAWRLYQTRNWRLLLAIPALGVPLAAVYLPMKLAGATSSQVITDEQFIHWYGLVRHYYHIVPSTWEPGRTVRWGMLLAAMGICLWRYRPAQGEHRALSICIVVTSTLGLAANYVFVETFPLALFTKLQIARTTPFVYLTAAATFGAYLDQLRREGRVWTAALLLVLFSFPQGLMVACAVLLALAAGLDRRLPTLDDSRQQYIHFLGGVVALMLLWILMIPRPLWPRALLVLPVGFLTIMALAHLAWLGDWFDRRPPARWALPILVLLLLAGLGMGLAARLPAPLAGVFDEQIQYWLVPDEDLAALAVRFKQQSAPDETVLAPPSAHAFKLDARRPDVVNFKCIPYTDAGIVEWAHRLEAVLGQPLEFGVDKQLDDLYQQRTPGELAAVARQYRASTVLTQWHHFDDAELIDQQGPWRLYRLSDRAAAP